MHNNHNFFQQLKTIVLIFLTVFLFLYFIFNGASFWALLKYKTHQLINAFQNELTRPLNFDFLHLSVNKNQSEISVSPSPVWNQENSLSSQSSISLPILPPEALVDNILELPKFGIKAPILRPKTSSTKEIYSLLRQGVVLYPGTTIPGGSYAIILGHSSSYPWTPGRYKSVFSLLNEFQKGDLIYVFWEKKPLVFQVVEKQIFLPWPKGEYSTETIFPPEPNKNILILQSCWPVGVDFKRVAIKAVLISQNPN